MQLYRSITFVFTPAILTLAGLARSSDTFDGQSRRGSYVDRPNIKPHPLHPGKQFPHSPPRDASKYCFVKPSCPHIDDSPNILEAFQRCNHGGTVVFDATYNIASPLDLTFLDRVDVAILGTIGFNNNISYWTEHSFKYEYQNSSAMWRFGGKDVNIYGLGDGLIDGNGQAWYDAFAANRSLQRPILFVLDGLQGGSVSSLQMKNPPMWFNFIANSSEIVVSDIKLNVESTNGNPAKNTDVWDTYRSDSIVLQDSIINNGDDCVSFKPNSTNIVVQGLQCNGSHGISVGSLGQYINEFDIVENVYVYNISMSNASDGARIKVWPGSYTPFQPSLSGGGGSGYVTNVTSSNLTLCNEYPSNMTISNVIFKNMWGTTSKKYDPKVGTLVCSTPSTCSNIRAQNITIQPPSGKLAQWICNNVNNTLLDINCVAQES